MDPRARGSFGATWDKAEWTHLLPVPGVLPASGFGQKKVGIRLGGLVDGPQLVIHFRKTVGILEWGRKQRQT